MKLIINEKMLSLNTQLPIKKENGTDFLMIESKLISIGKKRWIKDMQGNEVTYIEEKLVNILPTYDIYINNELTCSISKKIALFKKRYELSNGFKVEGDMIGMNFSIYNEEGTEVSTISRPIISIGYRFEIDIIDENNYILIIAIIVTLITDVLNEEEKRSNNN